MDGDRNNPQPRANQHHDRSSIGLGELGEVLGVSRMVKAGAIEGFLVYRVGDERSGAPAADITDGGLDRAEDRRRIVGVWAARRSANRLADRHDRKRLAKDGRGLIWSIDGTNRHRPAESLSQ